MYTNDDLKNLSGDDKKRKRNSLEMDLVMVESENRKLIGDKNNLNAEIRKIGLDQNRLRITLDEKKKSLTDLDYKIKQNEEEIIKIKKKINIL